MNILNFFIKHQIFLKTLLINVCETKSKLTKPIYTKTNELKQNDLNSANFKNDDLFQNILVHLDPSNLHRDNSISIKGSSKTNDSEINNFLSMHQFIIEHANHKK